MSLTPLDFLDTLKQAGKKLKILVLFARATGNGLDRGCLMYAHRGNRITKTIDLGFKDETRPLRLESVYWGISDTASLCLCKSKPTLQEMTKWAAGEKVILLESLEDLYGLLDPQRCVAVLLTPKWTLEHVLELKHKSTRTLVWGDLSRLMYWK